MRRQLDFGRGLYGAAELARYVVLYSGGDAKMSRVPYWLRHGLQPASHKRYRPDYGFLDLISLLVVRDLLAAGLRLRQIRLAEEYLERGLGHPRPFATEKIYSDGANVFYEAAPKIRTQITAADLEGQEAIRDFLSIKLKGVGYVDGVAASWQASPRVLLDPDIQFGEPCVAGTRVQTRQLAKLASRGESTSALAEEFELGAVEVKSALGFEEALATI